MRSATGQASLEYTGAALFIAAVLALAVPLAGRPPLAEAVASGIRHGICVVTGGVCTPREARALGLSPCTLREDAKGERNGTTVAIFSVDNRFNWILTQRSDGSVLLTSTGETDFGAGRDLSIAGVGIDGMLTAGLHDRAVWEFPSPRAARQFVLETRSPKAAGRVRPPTYRYESVAGGADVGAAGLKLDVGAAVGRRRGRGLDTLFARTRIDDPSPFARLVPGLDALERWQDITVEYTRNAGGPREIAFHLSGRGATGGTVVRVTGRLDLRDPDNAEAAAALLRLRAPWPPAVVAGLRGAVARTLEAGTVEAELLEVKTSSKGFDATLPVVKALGLRHEEHRASARLLAARAWVGGTLREREDCVPS